MPYYYNMDALCIKEVLQKAIKLVTLIKEYFVENFKKVLASMDALKGVNNWVVLPIAEFNH
jgi:hypothetical protein